MANFITQSIKDRFAGIIKDKILTRLNDQQFGQLIIWLCDILDNIFILFSIGNSISFMDQLMANNAQDLIGIFLLLLPYIDNLPELKTVKSLEEIYVRKKENCDISKETPKYVFSNIQYNRCKRNPLQEVQFDMEHLRQNYVLLKMTLQTISNRLYINWTNVVPMTFETYEAKKIFQDTKTAMMNKTLREWNIGNINQETPPTHLYIGTIYETIRHYMYDQIKNIKWLLFDYDVNKNIVYDIENDPQNENIKILPFIKILCPDNPLEIKINLTKCFDGKLWDDLDDSDIDMFTEEWRKFRTNDNYYDMVKAIAMYFSADQTNAKDVSEFYRLTIKKDAENDEICEETKENVMKSVNSIPIELLYEFLRNSLHSFKSTMYYHMLYGGLINRMNTMINIGNIDIHLTPKNVYNFAKSFSHYRDNGKFTLLPERWVSLDSTLKQEVFDRLNRNKDRGSWFNIQRNLKRVYNFQSDKINKINDAIYEMCIDKLINIVFDCLVVSGTISEFTLDTNRKLDDFGTGFYYLNGKKYGEFEMYDGNDTFKENGKTKYRRKTYLEFLKGLKFNPKIRSSWLKMYAMNWVSQINFFHKYLNNRIIMATGGTGVGKSTQLPKLLLYSLKMVDYKDTGKIICSQPRKRPTSENAGRIASEMGVTIKAGDDKDDYDSSNYNVQYQNSDQHFPMRKSDIGFELKNIDASITENMPYPILKIVTDKILMNSITDPLYKTKHHPKDSMTSDDDTYGIRNLYDIVIVDESHEHNQNMDMILTLMKRVLYYNNDCKLVIISATMDDDEPIYRRFYRDINDNRMYPLNMLIKENKIDRINVDRRLHISVPGQTTRYIINQKFLDKDLDLSDDDSRNQLIVTFINKIVTGGKFGDILVFKAGRMEIEKCAQLLNTVTPSNVYAIPYYGELPEDVRNFIEKVHLRKSELKISKDTDISEIKSVDDLKIGDAVYDHIIIVATNVAEASITIDTLTDVIDDGLQKVNTYYPDRNGSILRTQKIAESNRLQRKGRVGRTGDGNVYYLYREDSLKGVRNIYKMCIEDITVTLFSLLYSNKDIILFDDETDPNKMRPDSFNNELYKMRIDSIIKKQYFIGKKLYEYFGDPSQYDYENVEYMGKQYSNGFTYENLIDDTGSFYIIHPNESEVNRNILGNITKQPVYNRVEKHFSRLTEQFLILRNGSSVMKTDYGIKIEKIFLKTFLLETNGLQYVIACVFASIYNCFDDVLKILTMLQLNQKQDMSYCGLNGESDLFALLNVINNKIKLLNPNNKDIDIFCKMAKDNNIKDEQGIAMIRKFNENKNAFSKISPTNNLNVEIGRYINIGKLQTHAYNLQDMITLSFLHAFGHNVLKKLSGTKYYVSLKYPLKDNVKIIKKSKTCVNENMLNNYLMYINIQIRDTDDIANSEVSMIHYVKPILLKHIAYQFQPEKYIRFLKDLHENVNYKIIDSYDKARYEIISDVREWNKSNSYEIDIFSNVSNDSQKIIAEIRNKNIQYIQSGGGKKYKLVHLHKI